MSRRDCAGYSRSRRCLDPSGGCRTCDPWPAFPLALHVAGLANRNGTAPGTPFSPHSVNACATNLAGMANTATSMSPSTSLTERYALWPSTSWALGWMGQMRPRYPPLMRFFITELPILPSSADAPITATVCGRGRSKTERNVLQHLDQYTSKTERDQLAKALIGDRSNDHSLATGEASAGPERPLL